MYFSFPADVAVETIIFCRTLLYKFVGTQNHDEFNAQLVATIDSELSGGAISKAKKSA